MKTFTLQICGTGSGVGKSIIVTALCRIFLQDGYRVCPFKAQNMSLNSYVTKEGGEISRAQATQAQACRIDPHIDMNPVLIKPLSDKDAQVILNGKPVGNMSAKKYINYKSKALKSIIDSFTRLKNGYEIIVIEGAGSPAEINLKSHDIVNMKMAEIAAAPVILAGDIDKGGVFASLVGTLELLPKRECRMIKGFLVNKFRGDKTLLKGGLNFLQKRTAKPILGVIPYFNGIKIPEEDSIYRRDMDSKERKNKLIDIAVIKLPHISNFTDFDSLENEPDVRLSYISDKYRLNSPDVIIIPGTKNTISDLVWLKESGIAGRIFLTIKQKASAILIGICGGYQILGCEVRDTQHIESARTKIQGLGILPVITDFEKEKILSQIKADEITSGARVSGYEIHHGRTKFIGDCQPVFKIIERCGQEQKIKEYDGAVLENGRIWGTYLHGVFDEPAFRRDFLNRIRLGKSWLPFSLESSFNLDTEFDKLADLLRKNINMKLLYKILKHGL